MPGIILAIIGVVIIAAGSLLATYGWDKRGDEQHHRNYINAVYMEIKINKARLDFSAFNVDWVKTRSYVSFPTFSTVATNAAEASGLFGYEDPKELNFRILLIQYVDMCSYINAAITSSNLLTLPQKKPENQDLYLKFLNSKLLASFEKKSDEYLKMLERDYGCANPNNMSDEEFKKQAFSPEIEEFWKERIFSD